jgi:TatD DNase family protein
MYDTHAHLDLFLHQNGFWPNLREEEPVELLSVENHNLEDYAINFGIEEQSFLEQHIQNHDWIIQPTVSSFNFLQSWKLIANPKIYLLLGSHPEIVQKDFDLAHYLNFQNLVIEFINSKPELKTKLVGIGECGLDYFYSHEPNIIQTQKDLFESQIKLAIQLNLPLIIHCREAFEDLFVILKKYPEIHGKFLIHCFTGNANDAEQIIKLQGKMAIGGIVTFNSAKNLSEAVEKNDINNFVVETDLPFLAPNPFRGKICEPMMVEHSLRKLADLQNMSYKLALETSKFNAEKFFNI